MKGLPVEFVSGDNAWQLDTVTNGTRAATVTEQNIAQSGYGFSSTTGFRGIRYLYNAIDQNSPSYLPSRGLIGFNNIPGGSKSPLCDSTSGVGLTLGDFGFAKLDTTNPPAGSNLGGSACRRYLGV